MRHSTGSMAAPEAELAVVGGCLIDPEAIQKARGIVTVDMLASARLREIYRAMLRIADAGKEIDPVTVQEDLRARGKLDDVGGLSYLAELMDAVPTAANIGYHAEIVADRAARRRLEAIGRQIAADAGNPDLSVAKLRARIERHAQEAAELDDDRLPPVLPLSELPPPEPVKFAVKNLLVAADINLGVADGGVGKTLLATAISGWIANGSPVFDRPGFETIAGPIMFVSEEDPESVIVNRLEALARGHGWDWDRVRSRFHLYAQKGVSLDSPEWQAHLMAEAKRIGAVLVVFDPLTELTEAAENSAAENKPVVRFLRRLAVESGAAVLLIHHLGKAVEGRRKIDRIRGSSSFHAAARSVLFLEHAERGVRVEVVKFNRGLPPAPFVLERHVEAEGGDASAWMRARLTYQTQRQAAENNAERFVCEALKDGRLNTTELKRLAKQEPGVSAFDVTNAIKNLHEREIIDFELGKKNAKLWGLACLPDDSRQPRQPQIASLPVIAGQPETSPPVVAPLYRGQPAGNQPKDSRQPEEGRELKATTYPCTECGQHRFPNAGTVCYSCRQAKEEAA